MYIPVKTKPWMCMPVAFGAILDCDLDYVFGVLGHDGGEIIPGRKGIERYRSFHIQEMVDLCHICGYALTEIETDPSLAPEDLAVYPDKAGERILWHIQNSVGVIYCQANTAKQRHVLINDHGIIYDPDTGKETDILDYVVYSYYRVDRITE